MNFFFPKPTEAEKNARYLENAIHSLELTVITNASFVKQSDVSDTICKVQEIEEQITSSIFENSTKASLIYQFKQALYHIGFYVEKYLSDDIENLNEKFQSVEKKIQALAKKWTFDNKMDSDQRLHEFLFTYHDHAAQYATFSDIQSRWDQENILQSDQYKSFEEISHCIQALKHNTNQHYLRLEREYSLFQAEHPALMAEIQACRYDYQEEINAIDNLESMVEQLIQQYFQSYLREKYQTNKQCTCFTPAFSGLQRQRKLDIISENRNTIIDALANAYATRQPAEINNATDLGIALLTEERGQFGHYYGESTMLRLCRDIQSTIPRL